METSADCARRSQFGCLCLCVCVCVCVSKNGAAKSQLPARGWYRTVKFKRLLLETNCDRFRTGLGLLRPRSENCKLRNSSGEQPMQNVQLLKLCGSLLGRAGQSKPMKVEQAVGESALAQPTRNEGANGLLPSGEEWLELQGCPRRPMRLLIKKPYPMLRRSAFGPDIGLPSRISVGF